MAEMTDDQIIDKCAERLGYVRSFDGVWDNGWYKDGQQIHRFGARFNPITNDEQAMSLVKVFGLCLAFNDDTPPEHTWEVWKHHGNLDTTQAVGENLNRTICKCVSSLPKATHA